MDHIHYKRTCLVALGRPAIWLECDAPFYGWAETPDLMIELGRPIPWLNWDAPFHGWTGTPVLTALGSLSKSSRKLGRQIHEAIYRRGQSEHIISLIKLSLHLNISIPSYPRIGKSVLHSLCDVAVCTAWYYYSAWVSESHSEGITTIDGTIILYLRYSRGNILRLMRRWKERQMRRLKSDHLDAYFTCITPYLNYDTSFVYWERMGHRNHISCLLLQGGCSVVQRSVCGGQEQDWFSKVAWRDDYG